MQLMMIMGFNDLLEKFSDSKAPAIWAGISSFTRIVATAGFCYNGVEENFVLLWFQIKYFRIQSIQSSEMWELMAERVSTQINLIFGYLE